MQDQDARSRSGAASVTARPFQIRGRFLTAIAIRVESDPASPAFHAALDEQLKQTPQFFGDAPVVIDFERIPELADLNRVRDLVATLRRKDLRVFGVQNASPAQAEAARQIGLIPIHTGREAPLPSNRQRRAERLEKLLPPENRIISTPVRSGQTVVVERGDLTVIGSVASGAELVAGGSIHVYGRMRGRAMAGVHGDEKARIFCQSLDAELLAIAGLYRTSETFGPEILNRGVHVFLEDEKLRVEAFA